jgi:excisionase family DNA binding protein
VENNSKIAYRPKELAASVGMSKRYIYSEIRSGNLRALKVGRARVIRAVDAHAWLDRKASA